MTREESRARNALEKVSNKCRKQVAKSFGWKQCDYLNWKIDSGYYFSLCHLVLEQVELSVKPYFIDDLWWDIFEMPGRFFSTFKYDINSRKDKNAPKRIGFDTFA